MKSGYWDLCSSSEVETVKNMQEWWLEKARGGKGHCVPGEQGDIPTGLVVLPGLEVWEKENR